MSCEKKRTTPGVGGAKGFLGGLVGREKSKGCEVVGRKGKKRRESNGGGGERLYDDLEFFLEISGWVVGSGAPEKLGGWGEYLMWPGGGRGGIIRRTL